MEFVALRSYMILICGVKARNSIYCECASLIVCLSDYLLDIFSLAHIRSRRSNVANFSLYHSYRNTIFQKIGLIADNLLMYKTMQIAMNNAIKKKNYFRLLHIY